VREPAKMLFFLFYMREDCVPLVEVARKELKNYDDRERLWRITRGLCPTFTYSWSINLICFSKMRKGRKEHAYKIRVCSPHVASLSKSQSNACLLLNRA
jgi:hypothetical protein